MDAYIIALIEIYSNDLLSLVDELNKYPGAQIIAKVIAIFDCLFCSIISITKEMPRREVLVDMKTRKKLRMSVFVFIKK